MLQLLTVLDPEIEHGEVTRAKPGRLDARIATRGPGARQLGR